MFLYLKKIDDFNSQLRFFFFFQWAIITLSNFHIKTDINSQNEKLIILSICTIYY